MNIGETGQVWVNGIVLEEPYITTAMTGDCEIEFPQEVPTQSYCVLGDNRHVVADSRTSSYTAAMRTSSRIYASDYCIF